MGRYVIQAVPGVLILLLLLHGSVFAGNDFALRPELDLAGPLGEGLSWGWKLETEIDSHAQSGSAINLLARLSWRPLSCLSVTPELVYGTKGGDPHGVEWRPRLGIESGARIGAVALSVRGRAEYRMKEGQSEYWRYRGRLKLKFPPIAGLKPFIYDEGFYEAGTRNELNTNEAGLGVGKPLMTGVSLGLDFRVISAKKNGQWQDPDLHLLATFQIRF